MGWLRAVERTVPPVRTRTPRRRSDVAGPRLDADAGPDTAAACGCVAQSLIAAAARRPNAVAIEDGARRRSYGRLADEVARCARGLDELGVRPGHRVAIVAGPSGETVVALHAVLRIGAVAVVHDPASTSRELRRAFEDHAAIVAVADREAVAAIGALPSDLHPKAIVVIDPPSRTGTRLRTAARSVGTTVGSSVRSLAELRALARRGRGTGRSSGEERACSGGDRVIPWRLLEESSPLDPTHRCPAPRDLALLQYTVGQDGEQLGAMLTHENLVAGAEQVARFWSAADREALSVCSTLPLHEAAGAPAALVAPLLAGHRLVLAQGAAEVLAAAGRERVDVLWSTPAVLIAAEKSDEEGTLRAVGRTITVQHPRRGDVAAQWESATGTSLSACYVRAECGIALGADVDPAVPDRLGRPLPGVEVRRGADGLLRVAGPQVFHGYWNRPDETAHVLSGDGWVTTDDEVRIDEGGIHLVRRHRPGIRTPDGRTVAPREIAGALLGHPAVAQARAIARDLPEGGEVPEAMVVLREGAHAQESELRAWAAERLSPAKLPTRIRCVSSLPEDDAPAA